MSTSKSREWATSRLLSANTLNCQFAYSEVGIVANFDTPWSPIQPSPSTIWKALSNSQVLLLLWRLKSNVRKQKTGMSPVNWWSEQLDMGIPRTSKLLWTNLRSSIYKKHTFPSNDSETLENQSIHNLVNLNFSWQSDNCNSPAVQVSCKNRQDGAFGWHKQVGHGKITTGEAFAAQTHHLKECQTWSGRHGSKQIPPKTCFE